MCAIFEIVSEKPSDCSFLQAMTYYKIKIPFRWMKNSGFYIEEIFSRYFNIRNTTPTINATLLNVSDKNVKIRPVFVLLPSYFTFA